MRIALDGKRALVTGSTGGIGFAAAKGLAAAGATVIVNGRTAERVEAAIRDIRLEVPEAKLEALPLDLAAADGCAAAAERIPAVDILVNNLGIFELKPFFEIDDADWERFFQANVMSGVRLSRSYLKGMMERGWGRIVFISSESALNIPADMVHYGFTKTAQLAVSRGLAKVARGSGVTVNAVLPGPTASEGVSAMLKPMAEEQGISFEEAGAAFVKAERSSSVIQRLASVEEVANMIVYVCSEQASATSGAALRVDGGVVDTIA
ncbi:SDR family NAD(P)-dependent oxidoreductase [Aureimonas leprariae]|uniref:SDR family NAD(P)-dependent oxidoreductase n=1 Tax=Plantimonas leprariae TaxID=2615207 RepID=A0A7V7PTB4_9HYPH|nr:SDR family NAD(P)-dependent oxidoreductase [Aureimonas leprariae]KAB0682925.1 SDR family NAD(P)-dependent oxidoreductase [Aureimonas leprariae]